MLKLSELHVHTFNIEMFGPPTKNQIGLAAGAQSSSTSGAFFSAFHKTSGTPRAQ